MSLILDALKKIDRERTARKKTVPRVSDDILRPHDEKPPSRRWLPAAAACAFAAGALGYVLYDRFYSASPPAALKEAPPIAAKAAEPKAEPLPAQRSPEAISQSLALPQAAPAAKQETPVQTRQISAAEKKAPPRKESLPTESKESTPVPELKITGIVWQDFPAERRAVVNGHVSREGAVVEGMKIVEILPDRVRFSRAGKIVEVPIFR